MCCLWKKLKKNHFDKCIFFFVSCTIKNRMNTQHVRHVGYHASEQPHEEELFNQETISYISKGITNNLTHIRKGGVVVTDRVIIQVLNNISRNYIPNVGGIHTRLHIPRDNVADRKDTLINRCIHAIVDEVGTTLEMEAYNKTLTPWSALRGDFNLHGLSSHSKIYTRERKPPSGLFNMNY